MKIVAGNGVRRTALAVGRQLGSKLLVAGSSFNVRGQTVLNWGSSDLSSLRGIDTVRQIINPPEAVAIASSKIKTLEALAGSYCIEYTTDRAVAVEWFGSGRIVVGRLLDRGNSGEGIVIAKPWEELPEDFNRCSLYTKYFKANREYRLHCGKHSDGVYKCFDIQRKGLRTDEARPDVPDFLVRNHDGGFTFVREDLQLHDDGDKLKAVCSLAVKTLGLDFGAVDVRVNDRGEIKVIEVNTAPGLTGTTLENYVEYLTNNWMV